MTADNLTCLKINSTFHKAPLAHNIKLFGGSVVIGYVRGVILNDQTSSQILHLERFQRSLWIQILRALPVDMMRRVGYSVSHVALIDGANFCGG